MSTVVSDVLVRIKNAQRAGHRSVRIPKSRFTRQVVELLGREGYVGSVREEGGFHLSVDLKYFNGKPVISELSPVSRSSLRVYKGHAELPRVWGGLGVAVVSTSQGLMTDRQARERGIGGEIVCVVA